MKPQEKTAPTPNGNSIAVAYPGKVISLPILTAIIDTYGSFYDFKDLLKDAALKQFGSGYAWLVLTPNKELAIVITDNQNTPLSYNLTPLLPLDVWEHAYYLSQRNNRAAYIENWFHVINWDAINYRYLAAL